MIGDTTGQQGFSPFHYCMNNPVNFIDPLGLSSLEHGQLWQSSMRNAGIHEINSYEDVFYANTDNTFEKHNVSESDGIGYSIEYSEREVVTKIDGLKKHGIMYKMGYNINHVSHFIPLGEYYKVDLLRMGQRAQGGEGLWDKIVNTASVVADYTIILPIDFTGAAYDFGGNYYDMINANFRNSDKYFHAKANFQATHRGPGGQFFAEHFSNLREIWDQNVKGYPRSDSELDQKANLFGRTQTNFFAPYNYRDALKRYRPPLLPTKY